MAKGFVLNSEAVLGALVLLFVLYLVFSIWGGDMGNAIRSGVSSLTPIAEGLAGKIKEITADALKGWR